MYLGCVLSDLTEHGADRLSLITFVWISISPGSQSRHALFGCNYILPASRLGYSALFGGEEQEMPAEKNVSEGGMYENFETGSSQRAVQKHLDQASWRLASPVAPSSPCR